MIFYTVISFSCKKTKTHSYQIRSFFPKQKESAKPILVMELCEKGNLLEVLREPSNAFGVPEEEYLRFFSHLGVYAWYQLICFYIVECTYKVAKQAVLLYAFC